MTGALRDPALARRMEAAVLLACTGLLSPLDLRQLRDGLVEIARGHAPLPRRGRGVHWARLAAQTGLEPAVLASVARPLGPALRRLRRELAKPAAPSPPRPARGRRPTPLEDHPAATPGAWSDPARFHEALDLHMRRHGDTLYRLKKVLRAAGHITAANTLQRWRRGDKLPTHRTSFAVLALLERRWRLPPGYFRAKLPTAGRAVTGQFLDGVGESERRHIAWHLPADFDARAPAEQEEILAWIRRVIVQGATDYRRFHAMAVRTPFALRFSAFQAVAADAILAPPALAQEAADLVAFKTARFAPLGLERNGVWSQKTARQRVTHLGLLLGALAASPNGAVKGMGADPEDLSLALLVFPRVWDWYLAWREARRGFFTIWEADMLVLGMGLTGEAGWIAQTPALAERLRPLPGLVTAADIAEARADWRGACGRLHRHARLRRAEVRRLVRVHNDPFEPILPVLEAESPLGEYRKIADEVLRLRPCPERYPLAAAEALRAALMVRLALHLGFRQKNLRELLVCRRGEVPRSERELYALRRGELRWSARADGWEVFAPVSAFKNGNSSFFAGRPYRLLLPDVAGLYDLIDDYLATARPRLLGGGADCGVFFVKTVKRNSDAAAYSQVAFYQAWRWITQRYGVRNPWTGRGAIEGLLPHGPHCVRDVLAAQVLKQTGSFEQASYAIQDTPETVAAHYGRFLPQHKAELAAQVLNQAWE